MIQYFEKNEACNIVLNYPIEEEDLKQLKYLLIQGYKSWQIEFGRIYIINAKLVNLLYLEIFKNAKNIHIITHKIRLNRYLQQLGFESQFISLVKDDIVIANDIKIVLIGGSADSSEKIIELVKQTDLEHLTLVCVQHVEEHREGIFDEILSSFTNRKVMYASDGQKIEKACIYLAPSNKHLKVENGYLKLDDSAKYNYARPSISISYESFSNYYKNSLVVIQECGYAQDGVDKFKLLKENNTTIILQNRDECEATPMIDNARILKLHDYVFTLQEMIYFLDFLDKELNDTDWTVYLLKMIKKYYSYDFSLYNRDMIQRRIISFKISHQLKYTKDVVGTILFKKSAFQAFFLDVSINVTELFRHPKSFEYIKLLLLKSFNHAHSIKLWSAGCSNGKESYSLAILLQNLGMLKKSIIYATDFNSVVIEEAKNAIYSLEDYQVGFQNFDSLSLHDNLDNYVLKNENFVTITDEIRHKTQFFEHNLVTDGSFNEFDIIICKNVIIYFNYELQEKVFELFYTSLKFGGYLVLGKSEALHPLYVDKFESFTDNCKIYRKVS